MTTRGAAREEAIAVLRAAGDPTAALDADLLLAHVCGISKEALYAHPEARVGPRERGEYEDLVRRRAEGEPVAYLRGWKEFFGLRFAVDRRVLIPRPETEVLVEAGLAFIEATERTRVADIGTGSGAVAVALTTRAPFARVIAVDASAEALEVARANVAAHALEDRIELRQGDLLEPLADPVDLVLANLPYLRLDDVRELSAERTSLRFEPHLAVVAGADGLELIRRAMDQLPAKLALGGAAYFECDPPQAAEVEGLLREAIGGPARSIPDLTGSPRVVEGIRLA